MTVYNRLFIISYLKPYNSVQTNDCNEIEKYLKSYNI